MSDNGSEAWGSGSWLTDVSFDWAPRDGLRKTTRYSDANEKWAGFGRNC